MLIESEGEGEREGVGNGWMEGRWQRAEESKECGGEVSADGVARERRRSSSAHCI